jgi:hypothetical protein
VNPAQEYKRRLDDRNTTAEHYKMLDHRIGNFRLTTGIVFFVIAGLAAGPHFVSGWWLLLPLIVFIGLVAQHEKIRLQARRAYRAVAFYERGLARIEDRWMSAPTTAERPFTAFDENHPYATDLDIFGRGSLFELLSQARTRSGEQVLANWLMSPASLDEVSKRQQAVDELRNNIDLREDIAVLGDDVRATIRPEWMKRWATGPRLLHSPTARSCLRQSVWVVALRCTIRNASGKLPRPSPNR